MRRSKHRNAPQKDIPDHHLIEMFLNKNLPTADAIAEAFDNSLDAGASVITMTIDDNSVTFTDDGKGLKNLSLLVGIAKSQSRYKEGLIGNFGIGAIDAQLHFGLHAEYHSVHEGYYYKHQADWERIRKYGWPNSFNGKCQVPSAAPESIRKGGTLIRVTSLRDRPRVNMEALTRKLSHRYLPALRNNKQFVINIDSPKPRTYELDAKLATEGVNPGEVVSGSACGLPFRVQFSSLNTEHDSSLPGVHFAFGNRFIMRAQKLGDQGLPPTLYAEVHLAPGWKKCLEPNKTGIARHYEELCAAVLEILKGLIAKLENQVEQVHIEHVNLALARDFANVIVFDTSKKGDKKKGPDVIVSERGNSNKPVKPNPHIRANIADDGGEHGSEKKKKRPSGIGFAKRDDLGKHTVSRYQLKDDRLVIHLNGNIPLIGVAYKPPYKPIALWAIIAREMAKFCQDNAADLDSVLPGFADALNAMGWEVSLDNPTDLAEKVFGYVMVQAPLSKAERTKLSKLQVIEGGASS